MLYYMCHQSICSAAFSLKTLLIPMQLHCQTHQCKILTPDWLLSPLQVWSPRCAGCNLRGRVQGEAAAELREEGGWGCMCQPSADSSFFFLCCVKVCVRGQWIIYTPRCPLFPNYGFRICLAYCLCPIHDTDLYLYLHFHPLFSPSIPCSRFHPLTIKTYHKIHMTFISIRFITLVFFWWNCADRAQRRTRLSLFSKKILGDGLQRWKRELQ